MNDSENNNEWLFEAIEREKQRQEKKRRGCIIFLISLFVVIIVIATIIYKNNKNLINSVKNKNSNDIQISNSQNINNKKDKKYTYDKFLEIKVGMSYTDVCKILGRETKRDKNMVCEYQNNDEKSSNITVYYNKNKVIDTNQYEIKKVITDITMDKYKRLAKGMSYDDVKEILGEGAFKGESITNSNIFSLYEWNDKAYGEISLIFKDGKLFLLNQFDLK